MIQEVIIKGIVQQQTEYNNVKYKSEHLKKMKRLLGNRGLRSLDPDLHLSDVPSDSDPPSFLSGTGMLGS